MTTQRKLTRPGKFDNEYMVVTCTPDRTSAEFFEFADEARDVARGNLHPSTTTYLAKVMLQGEHAVRGSSASVTVLIDIDDELRRALAHYHGVSGRPKRESIALWLDNMLRERLQGLRDWHRAELAGEHTHPGVTLPRCARGRACAGAGVPCYPDCADFTGSGHKPDGAP
jgi:hypothetical protein